MCTVIVGYKLFPRHPLVIAANRDELLDRPTEAPKLWDGEPGMLAPVDLQRGGTPIGVNAHGVFAALTNRIDITSVGGQESRGDLVIQALEAKTAKEAALRLGRIDAGRYNGFHLIIGDAESLHTLHGYGKDTGSKAWRGPSPACVQRASDAPLLLIVSNLGIGPAHAPRAEAVMRAWHARRLALSAPHRATWDALLTIHDPHASADPACMKRMASTCIHRPERENYGTKSSAFILLDDAWSRYGAEWRWWHRERPDVGTPTCAGRWAPERRLAILPQ